MFDSRFALEPAIEIDNISAVGARILFLMKKGVHDITVLLVDDHDGIRLVLRTLLENEKDIKVVAEAQNGREAVNLAKKHRPNVIVMDITMPIMNGFEAARKILKVLPATKILILSAHSDDEYIDQMIEIGVTGYLLKQSTAEFLSEAIRAVKEGKSFFSPKIAKRIEERKNTDFSTEA